MELFKIFGSVLIKDDEAKKSLEGIDRQASGVGATFGKMIGIVATAGVALAAVAGGMVGYGVKGAASLEAYRNTLNVVMKDTVKAGEMMAWAIDFANKTPFETDGVVEATVRLTSYGLEAQKVLPSVGNMASVMNKDIMQAVEAVADAQTGELERLKEFGITKQMIIDQGHKTMKGKELVNNKGQIVDQQNFNKALFSLMDDKFKGGMDIQASSFNGLWSTITGTFKTSLAMMTGISKTGEVVVGGLFDTIKNKMKIAVDLFDKWSKDGTMDRIQQKVSDAFKVIINYIGGFIDVIKESTKYVKAHWDVIEPILIGIAAGAAAFLIITAAMKAYRIAMVIATTAQMLFNGALAINPIGIVIVAIGLLVAAGVYLYKNWDTVRINIAKIFDSMSYGVGTAMNWVKLKVLEAALGIVTAISKITDHIPFLSGAIDKAKSGLENMINTTKLNQDSREAGHALNQATYAVQLQEVELKKLESAGKDTAVASKSLATAKKAETVAHKDNTEAMKKAAEAAKKLREEHVKSLDQLGKAIVDALKKQYEQQEKAQTKAIENETKNSQKASDAKIKIIEKEAKLADKAADKELDRQRKLSDAKIKLFGDEYDAKLKSLDADTYVSVKAIEDQIEAISGKTKEEDKQANQQEYNKKLSDFKKKLSEAKTADDIATITKDMNDLIASRERADILESRAAQTEALKDQIELIKKASSDKKDALKLDTENKKDAEKAALEATVTRLELEKTATQESYTSKVEAEKAHEIDVQAGYDRQKEAIVAHFAALNQEEALQNEARKLAVTKSNKEIVELLNTYTPSWQNAGQSFGEALLDGLNSKKSSIQSAVSTILSLIATGSAASVTTPTPSSGSNSGSGGSTSTNPSTAGKPTIPMSDEVKNRIAIEQSAANAAKVAADADAKYAANQTKQNQNSAEKAYREAAWARDADRASKGLPALALGGNITQGGRVLVGEKRPEILDLPTGARVTPLDKVGGNTYNINIINPKFFNKRDIDQLGESFVNSLRTMGVSPS